MKKGVDNSWISFSDIMTGLMVIFMFIAIAYIVEVQKKQAERDLVFEEFKATTDSLYAELNQEFKDDFREWEVQLDKDLSIKFTNPDVLFTLGSAQIRPYFKEILNEFLPRYITILTQEKYRKRISEIRIEGHTDLLPVSGGDLPYIDNLELSQARSAAVMEYFISSDFYSKYSEDDRSWLRYNLTANGLSYGKTLDSNSDFTYISGEKVDDEKSRRVEFRIVTNSDLLVQEVISEIEGE
ncbi:flagellar motor protein MotB [Balneola sp. MJW-20]|uniref:OmpA/MotB family protein n=1 Tax=Gracilimonas aurantiaca TaxID=3234185 RepID=UPI003465BDFD